MSNIGPSKNKITKNSDGCISQIFPGGKIKSIHFLPVTSVLTQVATQILQIIAGLGFEGSKLQLGLNFQLWI